MSSTRRTAVGSTHSPRYRKFLTLLKRARVEAGLTQTQVAVALGRPQSFIAKCEAGERRIDVIELEQFARIYRRPIQYFLPKERRFTAGGDAS
jgi:transcriptional regulator with XRE-family HTH domain